MRRPRRGRRARLRRSTRARARARLPPAGARARRGPGVALDDAVHVESVRAVVDLGRARAVCAAVVPSVHLTPRAHRQRRAARPKVAPAALRLAAARVADAAVQHARGAVVPVWAARVAEAPPRRREAPHEREWVAGEAPPAAARALVRRHGHQAEAARRQARVAGGAIDGRRQWRRRVGVGLRRGDEPHARARARARLPPAGARARSV